MEGLDTCIGVGFLIRNREDLKVFEEAFHTKLSSLASVIEKRPTQVNLSGMSISQNWS